MKAFLMNRQRDFDLRGPLPWNEAALSQDLELETLLQAMAGDDKLVHEVCRRALLTGCGNDCDTILYRQAILADALKNPAALRELYLLASQAVDNKRKLFSFWSRHPSSVLYDARNAMEMFAGMLRRLRSLVRAQAASFASEGAGALFAMLERELSDAYLARVEAHLSELKFRGGVLISGELGTGNRGKDYLLRQPNPDGRSWLQRMLAPDPSGYTFRIPDRDEAGFRALSELRDRGINAVANALAQSSDHISDFFQRLRAELAFYVGCLNLQERLLGLSQPTCLPRPSPAGQRILRGEGLYDPCLALQLQRAVVPNGVDAGGRSALFVTGANQGGKSSFLRSLGVAQLMMQAGMFVAAGSFAAELCTAVLTHYKREEDETLASGKFDEELARMSAMADHLAPHALVLFNESFAATYEREGSEIARQVVSALLDKGIKILFVTHLHAFARGLFERGDDRLLFLRAERLADGSRTFRVVPGAPLATSHGKDLYDRIFRDRDRGASI